MRCYICNRTIITSKTNNPVCRYCHNKRKDFVVFKCRRCGQHSFQFKTSAIKEYIGNLYGWNKAVQENWDTGIKLLAIPTPFCCNCEDGGTA